MTRYSLVLFVILVALHPSTFASLERDPFNFQSVSTIWGTGSMYDDGGKKECVIKRDKKQKLHIVWSAKRGPSTRVKPS